MYWGKTTLQVHGARCTMMGFNGAVITEEIDLGQVYENPIQVFSRKQKSKEDLKIFRSNWEQNNKHHYGIMVLRSVPPVLLGSFLIVKWTDRGAGLRWTELLSVEELKNYSSISLCITHSWTLEVIARGCCGCQKWEEFKSRSGKFLKENAIGAHMHKTLSGGSGATRRRQRTHYNPVLTLALQISQNSSDRPLTSS